MLSKYDAFGLKFYADKIDKQDEIIKNLSAELDKAKRLLRLAVKDINLMTPFKSCSFCSFNNTNLCDPNVPCALQATWKYNDEVNEFLENSD